jgi:hypothetical protein
MEVYSWPFCGMTKCRGLCAGDDKIRFTMTSKSWIRWVGAALIALVLTVMPSVSPVHSVEDICKVSVISFGLFGDQGVFRNEATGAAQVVAGRFGSGPVNVQYNSKKGGGATIEALAMSLQVAANGIDAENDVLFLILTSHGSRAGLAVKAGQLTQTLTPSNLAEMLARAYDTRWWSSRPAILESLSPASRTPIHWSSPRPMPTIHRSAAGTRPSGPISAMPFSTLRSGKLKA